MSATDKARNKLQKLQGKTRETIGRFTGDRRLENEGIADRVEADLRDAGEKVKDAFRGRRRRRL